MLHEKELVKPEAAAAGGLKLVRMYFCAIYKKAFRVRLSPRAVNKDGAHNPCAELKLPQLPNNVLSSFIWAVLTWSFGMRIKHVVWYKT